MKFVYDPTKILGYDWEAITSHPNTENMFRLLSRMVQDDTGAYPGEQAAMDHIRSMPVIELKQAVKQVKDFFQTE